MPSSDSDHHAGRVERTRATILAFAFRVLYTRLAGLHEVTGQAAFGRAWHARRLSLLPAAGSGTVLDVGCGEGRLLCEFERAGRRYVGIDPSPQMTLRARRRNLVVCRAVAQKLPLRDASVDAIVCSYPGPWILAPETWNELARVACPGATVSILMGGDYVEGRLAWIRKTLIRLAYGVQSFEPRQPDRLGCLGIAGAFTGIPDEWGEGWYWIGKRESSVGGS